MMACKICLEDSNSNKDEILDNICACKGSAQAVHKKCLLEWLNVRKNQKESSGLCCEICLSEYRIVAIPKRIFRTKRFLEQERSEITAWILMALVDLVFLSLSVYFYTLIRDGHNFMIPMSICIGFCLNICKFCVVEFVRICACYEITDFTTTIEIKIQQ